MEAMHPMNMTTSLSVPKDTGMVDEERSPLQV